MSLGRFHQWIWNSFPWLHGRPFLPKRVTAYLDVHDWIQLRRSIAHSRWSAPGALRRYTDPHEPRRHFYCLGVKCIPKTER